MLDLTALFFFDIINTQKLRNYDKEQENFAGRA